MLSSPESWFVSCEGFDSCCETNPASAKTSSKTYEGAVGLSIRGSLPPEFICIWGVFPMKLSPAPVLHTHQSCKLWVSA